MLEAPTELCTVCAAGADVPDESLARAAAIAWREAMLVPDDGLASDSTPLDGSSAGTSGAATPLSALASPASAEGPPEVGENSSRGARTHRRTHSAPPSATLVAASKGEARFTHGRARSSPCTPLDMSPPEQ